MSIVFSLVHVNLRKGEVNLGKDAKNGAKNIEKAREGGQCAGMGGLRKQGPARDGRSRVLAYVFLPRPFRSPA